MDVFLSSDPAGWVSVHLREGEAIIRMKEDSARELTEDLEYGDIQDKHYPVVDELISTLRKAFDND